MAGTRWSKWIIKEGISHVVLWGFWQLCPLPVVTFPHVRKFLLLLPGPSVTLGPAEIRCQSSGQLSGLYCSNISLAARVPPRFGDIFPILLPFAAGAKCRELIQRWTGRFHWLPGGNINASTWHSPISPSKHLSCDVSHHFIAPLIWTLVHLQLHLAAFQPCLAARAQLNQA